MTEEQRMTEEQETPTVTMAVAGVLPVSLDDSDRKVGLLLMADGNVRGAELHED